MFLKQEKPEIDDFVEEKRLVVFVKEKYLKFYIRKNVLMVLMDTLGKTNILAYSSYLFILRKKTHF